MGSVVAARENKTGGGGGGHTQMTSDNVTKPEQLECISRLKPRIWGFDPSGVKNSHGCEFTQQRGKGVAEPFSRVAN